MFLVDQQFRLDAPEGLVSPGTDLFHVVESTMDLPLWIARVLDCGNDVSPPRYRKFFVSDAPLALQIFQLLQCSERVLYVLLPNYVTGLSEPILGRCNQVWQCEEPDGDGICWRVDVDGVILLLSGYGTSLGQEINSKEVWRDSER